MASTQARPDAAPTPVTEAVRGEGGPGVLPAWTSDDPTVAEARRLVADGRWAEADALLDRAPAADPAVTTARRDMRDLLARLRWEYGLGADELLRRVRQTIPDATAAEAERWRADGVVQWRPADGRPAYFRHEPANLFRFCADACRRAGPANPTLPNPAAAAALRDHLAAVVAEAGRTGREMVLPVRHRVRYTLTVPPGAPGQRPGAVVRAWLPFPQEYRQQRDVRLVAASPAGAVVAPTAEGEFPLRGAVHRSIYFERRADSPDEPAAFSAEYEYTSFAYYPRLDAAAARPLPADYAGGSLAERPPHIRFTPEARALAADITRGHDNPLARARSVFRWVATHVAYNAEEEYSLIPSLSEKALATRRGDCGVQAMAFITLCRAAGVPARWQSGWQTRPPAAGRVNMHDWAEFYVAPWGWLPADPSYGLQDDDRPAIRDFYCGHQDAWRLLVNRDYGCDLNPPKASPRSEPLDFQRGEVEVDGENLYFNSWAYQIDVQRLE